MKTRIQAFAAQLSGALAMLAMLALALSPRPASAQVASPCGGSRYGGAYGGSRYGCPGAAEVDDDKLRQLAECFEASVREKIREGYFVKNAGWLSATQHMFQDWTRWADNTKGGRCGEYGERGMLWIKPCLDKLYGRDALVDDIFVEERTTMRGQEAGWTSLSYYHPDKLAWHANHRATRVVLPDGRRFVVDYWESISSGTPRLVSEAEWIDKWRRAIGVNDSVVQLSEDQLALKDAVMRFGEDKGFQYYRAGSRNVGNPELWIRSWRVQPW